MNIMNKTVYEKAFRIKISIRNQFIALENYSWTFNCGSIV